MTIELDDQFSASNRDEWNRLRAHELNNPDFFVGSELTLNSFDADTNDPRGRDQLGPTPREEYRDRSGVNDAARSGGRQPELSSSASFPGTNTSCESPRQGRYGQVQITETEAGHQIMLNDTLGSESILIRHASGSGIEMRADGSILISGTQIHYNVRGNAQFVIEGNANFRSDGNMNFEAGGGMNFNASGEIAMRTPGDVVQDVGGDLTTAVGGHSNQNVRGSYTSTIMGERNETNLGGYSSNTQGDMTLRVDGDGGIYSSGNVNMTAQGRAMMSSPSVDITGNRLNVIGAQGTMGGEGVISYSLNSIVGSSLQAGKTVSAQSIAATQTLQTHSLFAQYIDTHTIESIRANLDNIESLNVEIGTYLTVPDLDADRISGDLTGNVKGNLDGIAKEADGNATFPSTVVIAPTTDALEDAIEERAPVYPDQRRTFVPTHQIIQDRQRGLRNGVRRVRVDPGNYIRNYMDRTVATGGNPNETVDRTPELPNGGGTVARPAGTPVPRQMTAAPRPRVPAAPHTAEPSTSGRLIQDLETRNPEAARSATEYVNSVRTVEGIGADVTWIPLEISGTVYMITSDFLRNEDGTYWRASTGEAQEVAEKFNAEIPSPTQIDAMWTAAGTSGERIYAATTEDLAHYYRYDPPLENNAANRARLIDEHNRFPDIAGQAQGSELLRAGHFKSIAKQGDTIGIYGWRKRDGSVWQPFGNPHGSSYYDYSQACRLIKEIEQ